MGLFSLIKQEPVLFQGIIQAGLGLVMAFGFKLEVDLMGAILAFTAALLSFVTRQQVTPLVKPKDENGRQLTPK